VTIQRELQQVNTRQNYWINNRRLSRRRLLQGSAGAGAAVAVLGLAACARSGAGTQGGTAAVGTPRSGGQFNINVNNDPFDWDMSLAGKTLPNGTGLALAYESLLTDARGPNVKYGDLTVGPLLATQWENPDPQTYVFHLRPGVKFANIAPANGRALTSADVKWSYEYWSRTGQFAGGKLPAAQFDWFFEGMQSVQTPDDATAIVKFSAPFAPFLNYAASDFNPIVPHEIYDQYGNLQDHVVGTGPWQLDTGSTQKGTKWVWKRNPTYWNSGKPYIDQVNFLVISDTATALSAFEARQLNWLGNDILSCNQAQTTQKSNASAVQFALPQPAWEIYLNVSKSPFTDERVRQALGYGLDRDGFIKTLDCGEGGWGLAGAFPTTFTQDEIKQIVKYDPQLAKQLLSAAGYDNGVSIDFIYPGAEYGDTYISEMQLLQAQLKQVGINLNLQSLDKTDFSNRKKAYNFLMTIQPKGDLLGDVDDYLFGTFYSKSKANYQRVNDPQLDAMILAQRQETDPTKRTALIKQAITYINQHALGLCIDQRTSFEFTQPTVKGYAPQFGMHAVPTADTWLQQ
jgi:peptide/nickel transport system substrate-binding protein